MQYHEMDEGTSQYCKHGKGKDTHGKNWGKKDEKGIYAKLKCIGESDN